MTTPTTQAMPSSEPLHFTIDGPPNFLTRLDLTISTTSLLLTFLLTLHSFALISPRIRTARHPRLLLLFCSSVLNLGSLVSNAWVLILIHLGQPTNLLLYYLARTVFFVGYAPLHTIAVLRRILILVASPSTHARALCLAYAACAVGYALATAGLWVASLESMRKGTLDAWMYHWTLPWYGTVAGGVFPLINVAFCASSLRFAWVHKSVGRGTHTPSGARSAAGTIGSASSMAIGGAGGAGGAKATNNAARVGGGTAKEASSALGIVIMPITKAPNIAARSIASFVLSSTALPSADKSAPRDVGGKSIVSAFWYLTLGEIAAWLVYIGLSAAPSSLHLSLITKNCIYDVLRVSIVVLEASFEQIYRRRYNKEKEKAEAAKHINSSMMLSTVGAYGGAVTHIVFPSSANPQVGKEKLPEPAGGG